MTEFPRDFFKNDPVLHKLYLIVMSNHKVAKHTEQVLIKNRHVQDFCEEARHFVEIPGANQWVYK
jgi:hypothetical protein